jgi:hypothetical protein
MKRQTLIVISTVVLVFCTHRSFGNIFGDGDPENGVEDSRIDMSSPAWNLATRRSWNMGAGTIHCDGRNRGSAVILDTLEFGGLSQGMIIATSAHVLFDLEKKRAFSSCRFHFMALDHLPGYQATIELERSSIGDFDPDAPRNGEFFGKEDWAFLYVDDDVPGLSHNGSLRLRSFQEVQELNEGLVEFQFIAFSQSKGSIAISSSCEVQESDASDLGGGGWEGQLLDNCDSEEGASGGGLVASNADSHFLVGIRSGSHWDGESYPPAEFPEGPPAGSRWDVRKNTNYSRAIDQELIESLRTLVQEINGEARI